jgi:myosin tail region-interacting protein MTI1
MVRLNLRGVALLSWAVGLASLIPSAHGEDQALPELNRKVLQFAEDHLGKQVGNGECWTLAAEALMYVGASRPGSKGVAVNQFGRKLNVGETILPGDVVQFEKAKFVHKSKRGASSQTMPHHTAIVAGIDGKRITLLHQNFGGKRTVGTTTIDLDDQKEGTVDFFRPTPKNTR